MLALIADPIAFWDKPEHGANCFNQIPPDGAYFRAVKSYGATWVRLAYDKWKPAQRDFLIGNADSYKDIPRSDLRTLKAVIDRAGQAGLKAVVAPLSLPGSRWAQNNRGKFDDRLWSDRSYWAQAAAFWRDLARELKSNPSIAAYNLINEPVPEKVGGIPEHSSLAKFKHWYEIHRGTSRDLPKFYTEVIQAIREVDPVTPIMVDSGWYGAADTFAYWPSGLADSKVLYSFHMYEPYSVTGAPNLKRDRPFAYPGTVPFGETTEVWDKQRIAKYLTQPIDWAKANGVPLNRLVVGEFGCMRRTRGCRQYLEDVLNALDNSRLHWAFYSFREDVWDGMDYELGSGKPTEAYWKSAETHTPFGYPTNLSPEFSVIRKHLLR